MRSKVMNQTVSLNNKMGSLIFKPLGASHLTAANWPKEE